MKNLKSFIFNAVVRGSSFWREDLIIPSMFDNDLSTFFHSDINNWDYPWVSVEFLEEKTWQSVTLSKYSGYEHRLV